MNCKFCGCELRNTADDYVHGFCFEHTIQGYYFDTNTWRPEDPKGWICPKCKKVYSPYIYECAECNGIKIVKQDTDYDVSKCGT